MTLRHAALLLVAVAISACNGDKKRDLADFAAAQKLFDDAKTAVTEGRLSAAHKAYCEMETVLIKLRLRSGHARFGEETVPPGRIIDGQTVGDWHEQWKTEFRAHVAGEFDQLHQRAVQGGLDWLDARAFFTSYGDNALDQRWQNAMKDVGAGQVQRAGDVYVWDCDTAIEGYCAALLATLSPKLARPLTTQAFLTGADRDAMFGIIEVRAWVGDDATYRQVQVGGGQLQVVGVKITMPSKLTLTLDVKTRRGHSSWDGVDKAVVQEEAPTTFSANEVDSTWRRQVARLQEKMASRLQAMENQTVTTE